VSSASAPPTEAVFVVGVSRSGTTLMRRILNRSSRVAISGENHYLGHLVAWQGEHRRLVRLGDLHDDRVVDRVVAYVYDGPMQRASLWRPPSRQWGWLLRRIPRDEFRQRLLDSDRSERAIFQTLLRSYADRKGKSIIGEKTPAHVRYADTLLSWFPQGRVIHMLRDPRAIYVSDLRRRRLEPGSLPYRVLGLFPPLLAATLLVQITFAWGESIVHMRRNRRRFPNRYLVVRFEDLVARPIDEVARITRFLGIEPEEAMLRQRVVSQGHSEGTPGFDSSAATRWSNNLGRLARAWFRIWLGRELRLLGYGQ
jgi:hypothetical protein